MLRLEDFNKDPKQHLGSVFKFMGLSVPMDDYEWEEILVDRIYNEHRQVWGGV